MKQMDAFSLNKGTTRSSVIRDAVHDYLDRQPSSEANLKRIAMMTEFAQVALDILIRELAPDRREDILATVQERMERYHA